MLTKAKVRKLLHRLGDWIDRAALKARHDEDCRKIDQSLAYVTPKCEVHQFTIDQARERTRAAAKMQRLVHDNWPGPSIERIDFEFHYDDGMIILGQAKVDVREDLYAEANL